MGQTVLFKAVPALFIVTEVVALTTFTANVDIPPVLATSFAESLEALVGTLSRRCPAKLQTLCIKRSLVPFRC